MVSKLEFMISLYGLQNLTARLAETGKKDGEVFDLDDSIKPPLHPFCRCSIAAYYDTKKGSLGYNNSDKRFDIQFFANKDKDKQTLKQLQKGIRSYIKRIEEHEVKIENQ